MFSGLFCAFKVCGVAYRTPIVYELAGCLGSTDMDALAQAAAMAIAHLLNCPNAITMTSGWHAWLSFNDLPP
jgi:hypothetical protein